MRDSGKGKGFVILLKRVLNGTAALFLFLKNKISAFIIKSDFKRKFKTFLLFLKKTFYDVIIFLIFLKNKISGIYNKIDLRWNLISVLLVFMTIFFKSVVLIISLKEKISAFVIKSDIKGKLNKILLLPKDVFLKIVEFLTPLASKLRTFFLTFFKWINSTYKKFIDFVVLKFPVLEKFAFKDLHERATGALTVSKATILIIIFIIIDIFLMWFISYRVLYAKHYWAVSENKHFVVKTRENVDELIDDLANKDIIGNSFIFKILVRLLDKDDKIISRRYVVKNGLSNSDMLNILTDKNFSDEDRFTIIEGYRLKQIAKISATKLQMSPEKFVEATQNDSLINLLGLKGKINSLEGFLFPDTYILPPDLDEKGLVEILFNEFRKKILNNREISKQFSRGEKNLLNIITMASIIQGETNLKDEMPAIAGVYYNRLRIRMKLEADPTIQYILPDGPKPQLLFSDLKIDSPYNTYKYYGLPPGPINNPGLYAIKAALNPEIHNYLFFVATGNGGHKFSENYKDHLKAIEEFKKTKQNKEAK